MLPEIHTDILIAGYFSDNILDKFGFNYFFVNTEETKKSTKFTLYRSLNDFEILQDGAKPRTTSMKLKIIIHGFNPIKVDNVWMIEMSEAIYKRVFMIFDNDFILIFFIILFMNKGGECKCFACRMGNSSLGRI